MNVGPTFDEPKGAASDDKVLPRLITWISKNPREQGEFRYKKTLLWSVPPKAVVGFIHYDVAGKLHYSGNFVTKDSPNGKTHGDLTDAEKEVLAGLVVKERKLVDEFHEKLKAKKKSPKLAPSQSSDDDANVVSSALAVRGRVGIHGAARSGSTITASVSATTSFDGTNLGRTRIDSSHWRLAGEDLTVTGSRVKVRLNRAGRFRLRVSVQDEFGAYGTVKRTLVVRPRR